MMPSSPRALTTSRPISLAMYSWVSDMSDERNSESCCAAILMLVGSQRLAVASVVNVAEGNKLDAVSLAIPNLEHDDASTEFAAL